MRLPVALTSIVSLLLTAACGEDPPPPAPAKVAPPPAPAPALAPPPPLPPPTGRALLVASEFGLSPIACAFDQGHELATGEACLPLVPKGAEVWLMAGHAAKITGFGATACPDAPPAPTVQVDLDRELLRGDAVIPPSLKTALTYVAPTRPDEVDRATPKDLRARLGQAVAASFPDLGAVKLRVEQRAELDLDGDGAPEALIAVAAPAAKDDDDAPARVSALFVAGKDGALTLLRGGVDTRDRYIVLGAIDLDGDGPRELYLNTHDDEGFVLSLERSTAGGLEAIGRWTCGA